MNVTMAINTNREIETTIAIYAPVLLCISESSCYEIVTLILVFCPFC